MDVPVSRSPDIRQQNFPNIQHTLNSQTQNTVFSKRRGAATITSEL